MKKLRAGIIGLGVGEQHIAGYRANPSVEIAAVCDFSEEKRAIIKAKYPDLRVEANAEQVLMDPNINVISIASFDNFHFAQAAQAVSLGKHVFLEKPICVNEKEAQTLKALLKERPEIKLSCNLILRKSPRFVALRNWIETGKMGQIYYLEGDYNYGRLEKITDGWRGDLPHYSVFLGGAVHLVDLLLWMTGDQVSEVTAYGNKLCSTESRFKDSDFVVALLKFKSGAIAKITANFGCVMPHFHGVSLFGTKATFVNEVPSARLYESRDPKVAPLAINEPYPGVEKGQLIPDFVESILEEREGAISTESIFQTMAVCFSVEKALQSGRSVPVDTL